MTGLEKITKQIRDEAQQAADQMLAAARTEAEEIAATARQNAEAQSAAIRAQSQIDVQNQLAAAKSAAELARRRAALTAKQEIIGEVIADAEKDILALPDIEYFTLILQMIQKYSQPRQGELLFSAKDFARLPAGFESKVQSLAAGPLTVSKETRTIDGGFVLAYGGVEENCSIEALFYAAHELLQDKVQEILFS